MRSLVALFGRRTIVVISLLILASTAALAQTETLRFDEIPTTPLNGLTFRGVTFTFTIGGVGSTAANYAFVGPGQIAFIQDPSAEGDANGTLTIAFNTPTTVLSFGVARSTPSPMSPGAIVQLFDPAGNLVQTTPLALSTPVLFAEAQFNYVGPPIRRAVLTFPNPAAALRWALDNLTYQSGPPAGPGFPMLANSAINDQKAGSVLFFNFYTSSPANPGSINTRFAITNTNEDVGSIVHLFFVDGSSCSVADRYVCLTQNQTMSFLASEQDPGTTGYLVAIAVNTRGCPINFNHLIGEEFIKGESGEFSNLGAEAIAAISAVPTPCDDLSVTALISFNGISYNQVPRVLALSNIASRADGTNTRVIVNRVGGNLLTGASTLGSIFGILYDDGEGAHSFSIPSSSCQRVAVLDDQFPRTTPRFTQVIPAGQTGWMKFWCTGDVGILGLSVATSANAQASAGAFNSGHNLHKLRLTSDAYTIPIFPPGC